VRSAEAETIEKTMTEDEQGRQKKRKRIWLALVAVVALLAVLLVPPFISVSRYKSQIANLMASSLGRPVRLSSMRLRLLPRPGFVLYDLTVEDDPAFGAEPLLRANTVTAIIRILSLWRGRLELSEVIVDEASVNLVRRPDGRWNLDPLFQTAASRVGVATNAGEKRAMPFPYIAATNSRVNIKNGAEKMPFSLIDSDLSFWQEDPGVWRLRLRGQPARTDVSLELADTGVVELNATVHGAPELQQMPVRLDLEWRDAQLGQLTRLVTGSDAGWRGDLRGEVHLDGTAGAAKITTRLRATGVHRAEFAPAEPMDFDANCSLVYHYSQRGLENLVCDSPLGGGRIRIKGDMPSNGAQPHYSVEMDRVPVAAGLDALRTVRNGVDPGLVAAGTVSGKVSYAESPAGNGALAKTAVATRAEKPPLTKTAAPARGPAKAGPLTGSFTVEGLQFTGGGLSHPLQAPKMVLEPAAAQGRSQALAGTVAIPAGAAVPLTVSVHVGFRNYQISVRGQASIQRGRELAHAAGVSQSSALDALAGDPLTVDLSAQGPWLPTEAILSTEIQPAGGAAAAVIGLVTTPGSGDPADPIADSLSGTVTVRNANWKADYLASHIEIAEATLHMDNGDVRWDPIDFAYGPLKATASLTLPKSCGPPETCPAQPVPRLKIQFGDLDAATAQTAILGAHEPGTLLSDLIDRLRPASAPAWPLIDAAVNADSLALGPAKLQDATAELHIRPTGIEITSLDARMLDGSLHGTGTLVIGDKPAYSLTADFTNLNPVAVGQLLGQNWRGGTIDASGKIDLAGFTGEDLAASAKGTLHFEWRHGSAASAAAGAITPVALSRFDRWTADAAIENGKITLGQNEVAQGSQKRSAAATVILAEPPKLNFAAPPQAKAKKR
jgi:hypothetical protein